MSRVDITATAAMAQWQERIEKERAHAQTRRDFTTNPKTMYVITEKPQQSGWSREFQSWRADEQAKLLQSVTLASASATAPTTTHYSPLTPAQAQAAAAAAAAAKPHYKAKGGGANPVHTAVAITSPLTHTTTVVGAGTGAGAGTPPATPPPKAIGSGSGSGSGSTNPFLAIAAGVSKSPAKAAGPLSSAGAYIASPTAAKPAKSNAPNASAASAAAASTFGATGAAATGMTATTGSLSATAQWKHMRSAPVRRDHPLAASDPSLASTLRRQDLGPTEKWEWPQTSSHEYGWNAAPVMPADRATHLWYKGLKSSDISEYVNNYALTQGGKTPFSTKTSADRPLVQSHD